MERELRKFLDCGLVSRGFARVRATAACVAPRGATLYPLFIAPVDVAVTTALGTRTYVAWMDELHDQFAFAVDGPATSIAIDPEGWMLTTARTTGVYATPFFAAQPETIPAGAGGSSALHMDQGAPAALRPYLVLAGLSGSQPGIDLNTVVVPVNYDLLTEIGIVAVNSPMFAAFAGALDAAGQGRATFSLPPGIGAQLIGRRLTFAYVLVDDLRFASRAVTVELR